MKKWEYEAITEAANATCFDCSSRLCEWPEVSEAMLASGIPLPGGTPMRAVREICRLILAERKMVDTRADSDETKALQSQLLDRGIYASRHDITECYRDYCDDFAGVQWCSLASWDCMDKVMPVDYIAARIGNGKPS